MKNNKYDNDFWKKVSKFWNFEKNKLEGNDNGTDEPWKQFERNSEAIIWLNCNKVDYHIYPIRCKDFYKGNRCCYCSRKSGQVHPKDSFAQWVIDEFGESYFQKIINHEKNKELEINIWNISKRSLVELWFNCENKDYHQYKMSPDRFYRGNRCKYCGRTKYVHKLDSLGYLYPQILDIWSDKNKKSPYDYTIGTEAKIWLKCKNRIHKDYQQQVKNTIRSEFSCPICSQENNTSKLQIKVNKYLNNIFTDVETEFRCNIIPINPKTKHSLPFDNEVVNLKLVCEIHGRQHYEEIGDKSGWLHGLTSKEYLYKRKLYDRYKKFIAYKKGYEYLEIPYWTDNKQEDWKTLINNKIKEIKSSQQFLSTYI